MDKVAEYHGPISKGRAEKILADAGHNGSYLIRDSESIPGTYCICVLCDDHVYTYRLAQVEDCLWKAETASGVKERLFRSVTNLILAFRKPNQGLEMALLYPVTRDLSLSPLPSPRPEPGRRTHP